MCSFPDPWECSKGSLICSCNFVPLRVGIPKLQNVFLLECFGRLKYKNKSTVNIVSCMKVFQRVQWHKYINVSRGGSQQTFLLLSFFPKKVNNVWWTLHSSLQNLQLKHFRNYQRKACHYLFMNSVALRWWLLHCRSGRVTRIYIVSKHAFSARKVSECGCGQVPTPMNIPQQTDKSIRSLSTRWNRHCCKI